jgi:hypothetical protein
MEAQMTEEQHIKKPRKRPVRSRFPFPSYDFGIALQITQKVEFEGAGRLSEATLAISLNASAKSSGFRLKTLAARQFRLLTKERDMLSTTPLAKAILKPTTDEEKKRRIMESFMAIPLFNAVANRFNGQPLPTTQPFRNILEREFGVESNRTTEAERILMDSAREAGLLHTAGDRTYLLTEMTPLTQIPQTDTLPPKFAPPTRQPSEPARTEPPGGLLTVSVRDIADLDDTEFKTVWDALGTIARIQGRRQKSESEHEVIEETEEDSQ